MKNFTSKEVLVGTVVGYKGSWNMFSHSAYVIVNAEGQKIAIDIDSRQLKFVRKEFPEGSQVPIGFYGGKWHIASKPVTPEVLAFNDEVQYMDVLNSIGNKAACEV